VFLVGDGVASTNCDRRRSAAPTFNLSA